MSGSVNQNNGWLWLDLAFIKRKPDEFSIEITPKAFVRTPIDLVAFPLPHPIFSENGTEEF